MRTSPASNVPAPVRLSVATRYVESAPVDFIAGGPADSAVLAAMDRVCFPHPWSEASFDRVLADPKVHSEIAIQGDQALGTCQLDYGRMGPDAACIDNLEVVPSARGHQLGEKLLLHALQEARGHGAKVAYLEVDVTNTTAQRLYEKFGFQQEKLLPNYYPDDGHDGYLMRLSDLSHAALLDR